jgi:hypothetical protein
MSIYFMPVLLKLVKCNNGHAIHWDNIGVLDLLLIMSASEMTQKNYLEGKSRTVRHRTEYPKNIILHYFNIMFRRERRS